MNSNELRSLEQRLWDAADTLRANSKLTATEYSFPILGIIFLRQAYSRFVGAKTEIEKSLPVHPERGIRPMTKNDFLDAKAIFLNEESRWPHIVNLPEHNDLGEHLNNCMKSIEKEYEDLSGVLPKEYNIIEKNVLLKIIRVFNDESLNQISGDAFGRIYEYFLSKFAMSGAQEGGEFFTPPSLVKTIVNIIEPNKGVVLDPAVGSAGMFVQTAHFIEEKGFDSSDRVTFFGQEKTTMNTKLAKMNTAVHGLDSDIVEGNTFYADKHDLLGKCDFVMANPPFNVDGVDKESESVKNDPRLPFGLPNNDNANYLWMQYFYSYLNDNGRAGFVMASSASDAGHSEKKIRQKIIETGSVDVMISITNNFFYTLSLPCALWFYDRAKSKDPERADKTLMLDLRKTYRKVNTKLNDFTDEQLESIKAIVSLYRGDKSLFNNLINKFTEKEKTEELEWLTSRFPDGVYADVKGLCKVVKRAEIAENDYSLTPGRYVGVVDQIDQDFDYVSSMANIKKELSDLNAEANDLAQQIQTNLDELKI